MKACSYCGCLNTKGAPRCRGCGQYFPGFTVVPESSEAADVRGIVFRYGPSLLHKFKNSPTLIWLVLFVPFIGYGLLGPGLADQKWNAPFDLRIAAAPMLEYGGLGISIATCVTAGTFAMKKVRQGSLNKILALLLAAGASAVAAVVPPTLMSLSELYQGMSCLAILEELIYTGSIGVIGFLISGTWILCIHRH